jgi:parvulin-like peptidyl-prolyl isomerase
MDGRLQTEDFAVVAEEVSTDTQSAAQGGDLGWFPRGIMTTPFEEAAFSQPVGELPAEPVQSEFGWHIILVVEREEDRPLTASMISGVQSSALNQWLDQQAESADISSTVTLPADDEPQPGLVGP